MEGAAARSVPQEAEATEDLSRPVDGRRRAPCDGARERFRVAIRADLPDRRADGREAGWLAAAAVPLRRYVARRVPSSADAEDIAQQAVLLAWEERSAGAAAHSPERLLAIARHLIVGYRRERSRNRLVELGASLVETEPSLQTRTDTAAVVVEGRERLSALLGPIAARLRLEHQVALLLADFHGHRDRRSAAVLGMSLPSFKRLLHGARARLRQLQGRPVAPAPAIPMLEMESRGSGVRIVEVQIPSRVGASGREPSCTRKVLRGHAIAVG
jgi:DNA-directed RNA polymerase specialized sigma24 family protein